ncbi:MAG: DUF4442 domain-containing protein [Ferruginibacter sp.]|nr:DUF4442 domain-containing protein [Ferruginibacter sp.]
MMNPILFRIYLIIKLPSAYFCGVRLLYLNENKCVATVPYKWFSKNPFGSTYFACLAMAAEMSTGVLALAHTYKKNPRVSMLVTRVEGNFMKKATGRTLFMCDDGSRIEDAVNTALASGKSITLNTYSYGEDKNGVRIAEFRITWSFMAITKK